MATGAFRGAAANGGAKETPTLTVSTLSKKSEVGIQTLIGDYVERGTNHGKKYFQKIQAIEGHEDIKVFMYYWDTRDGADFSGWWFGDQLGGTQVWARSPAHTTTPPRVGWKIPWDAEKAELGALFVDPYKPGATTPGGAASTKAAQPAKAAATLVGNKGQTVAPPGKGGPASGAASSATAVAAQSASASERVQKAKEAVETAETSAHETVSQAKELINNAEATEEELKQVQELLQQQLSALLELPKTLMNDINEVKKGGWPAQPLVTELSRLIPKARTLQASLTTEITKTRGQLIQAQQKAANAQKQAALAEQRRVAEENDSKDLSESLPETLQLVSAAEDAVESVCSMADPLVADPPDDDGDTLKSLMDEIERSAADAQNKIIEARKVTNAKLQAARKYTPTVQKTAVAEYSSQQQKLTDAQKKLNPYKTFRKEFRARVEARKAMADMTEKMDGAELEVEKASLMCSASDQGQMSEDEVGSAEKLVLPAQQAITTALRNVELKLKTASEAMKTELNLIKDRGTGARKKLEAIVASLRKQREGLTVQQMRVQAVEMADKAEQMLLKCQEAEMPFLKGIEVLPEEESKTAIGECEAAAAQTDKAVNEAKAFVRRKLAETAKMSKETSGTVAAELNEQLERADSVSKKVATFRKETTDRKTAALLSDIVDVLTVAENKVQALAKVCEVLASDDLETVSSQDLKEAVEKASVAEKEASAACLEARKCISSKSKESKAGDLTLAIAKLQGRLNTAQQEIAKQKKLSDSGNKLVKGKAVMVEEEERIKEAEDEVEKVEKLVNVAEGEELTDVAVQEMGSSVVTSQKALKSSLTCIQAHMPGAMPVVKAALQKLVDRGKASQEKLNKVLVATKDQRERVLAEAYVKEGTKKVDEVEEALERVNKAELPFLKGLEFLPLNEATETIAESEAAAAAVQTAISAARTFVASKNLEVKQFREAVTKPAAEEFSKQSERINSAAAKLSQFKKDTEARKKTALIQEAVEKMAKIEEDVRFAEEAVEPFARGEVDDMSTDDAFELCQKLLQQFKDLYQKMDESRLFIASRLQDSKAAGQAETLQKLQTRLSEARTKTAKTKAVVSGREQAIVAKKLLSEAQANVKVLDEAVQRASEACAPLLEHGGEEFLVVSSIQRLAGAIRIYLGEKDLTVEDMFKQLAGDDEDRKVPQKAFVEFLEKLPEVIGKEEITCTEERRVAIFNHVDEEKAGTINLEKFRTMLAVTYVCKSSISLTEEFEIANSKTVAKIEPNDELEAVGFPKVEAATGMTRVQCKVLSSGQAGFVTMLGNAGTVYLDTVSGYETFVKGMDQKVVETAKKASEVSEFFKKKSTELASTKTQGPLTESRNDLIKLRMKVTSSSTALDQLKKKVVLAKKEFSKKDQADKDAHIEIREKKAAAVATAEVNSKLEAMETLAKQLEDAAAPLLSLKGSELEAFTTPATLNDEVGKLSVSLHKCIGEARTFREEQLAKVRKEIKGPMVDVKRELQKLEMKASATSKKCEKTTTDVEQACLKIVEAIYGQASAHLRSVLQRNSLTIDGLFSEWLKPGEDRISESTFCERLESEEGLALKPEQVLLLCRHIERGGIGRRKFCSFLQQYFTVVKPIAITSEFDISKAKILRTSDIDEVIEVLEGPCGDDTLGLSRIRGRSLTDGMEGWVSVKGNKGTPFLEKVLKPYYACTKEVKFELESGERTLKVDEVLELIEGPRKQVFNPGLRVRGKACSDGATGWFTVKNRSDVVFAEADGKYYSCTTSVAMTDAADIRNCNVVRKLDKGEMFTAVGEPEEDKSSGILRIEGKALKDEKVGWITIKGNAGTIYADASSKHYTVVTETPLQKLFSSETSDTIRMLVVGEAIHSLEGPKDETYPPQIRMKGRLLSDDAVGWITKVDNVRPWSPYYKCVISTPLRSSDDAEAEVIRQLSVGETVELQEGPIEQSKEVRMKARAEKDGAVGWVTIKTADGKKVMQS